MSAELAKVKGPEWDSGEFKKGDRILMNKSTFNLRHVGALGTVVRVDENSIYPVIVWLDMFGRQTPAEAAAQLGLPTCANELHKIRSANNG